MGELYRETMYLINHMSTQQWLLVAVIGLVIGLFCMRGLGSRSSY
jgi:disulfide bond formation protein DsbB